MVRRVISLLIQDVSGVHKAAYLLALSAFFSQLLALIRDRLLAHTFGASTELDIYYAAFRVQDFLFFFIASLVSLSVLIPILVERMEAGKDEVRAFISSIFSFFLIGIAVFGVFLAFLTPFIVPVIFPGLLGKGFDNELFFLTRLLLLSPLILGLSNLLASVTQAYGKFFIYALSPLLYNIGIIIGVVFFYPLFGLSGLGYGVLLGALLHLSIQLPFILKEKLFPFFTFKYNLRDLRRVLSLSLPRTFTLSLNSIALLVLAGFASLMKEGSISILNFSFNLGLVPVAIIGASYSVAAFPILARHYIKKETKEFVEHLTVSLKHIIFWSFPFLVLLIVLRAQIVRVILGSGSFSWDDTRLTAACLAILATSIVAQNISLLFIRAFYAAGNTLKPLFISVISSAFIILSACTGLWFISSNEFFRHFIEVLFRVEDVSGAEVLVLPLAYSMGSFLNLLLFWIFFRKFLLPFTLSIGNTAFHSFSVSVCMGFVTYKLLGYSGKVLNLDSFSGIFFQGFFAGVIGIIFGATMFYFLKNEEFLEVVRSFRRRMLKTIVVGDPSPGV